MKTTMSLQNQIARATALGLMLCFTFSITVSNAATISVSSVASVDSPDYDLTNTYGIGDWAYWENNAGDGGSPLNEKSGATLIGDISLVGSSGSLAGSASTNRPVHDFDYADGISPISGGIDDVIGLLNNGFETTGNGVQVSVNSPTADEYTIYAWAAGFRGTGTLAASVGGASDSGSFSAGSFRVGQFFSVAVDPDSKGQTVNLSLVLTGTAGSFSHVSLAGVAVDTAPVPEPASVIPFFLGMVGLVGIRKRQR